MSSDRLFALDIGTTKIACVAADREGATPVVRGAGVVPSVGVTKGVVVDCDAVANCITQAVRKAERESKSECAGLVVSLGGGKLAFQQSPALRPIYPAGRKLGAEDLLQVVNAARAVAIPAGREVVETTVSAYLVDGVTEPDPVDKTGSKLEANVLVASSESQAVASLHRAVTQAGYAVDDIVTTPLAAADSLSEMSDGVVIDLGGALTSVACLRERNIVWAFVLPVGGRHVTADLAHLLRTSEEEAERLKISSGAADPAKLRDDDTVQVLQTGQSTPRPLQRKVLSEIIESRLRECAKLIHRAIEGKTDADVLNGPIVLTGGGSRLADVASVFEKEFGTTVRLGAPVVKGGLAETMARGEMAVSVGLLVSAIRAEEDVVPASSLGSIKDRFKAFRERLGGI